MYAADLSPRQREILATWAVKPAARAKAHASLGVRAEEIAVLHYSGFLRTLPQGGVYLADAGVLVLGAKMRDRLAQLLAQLGGAVAALEPAPAPAAPAPPAPKPPKASRARPELGPTFHRNLATEASARATYEAALARYQRGDTSVLRGVLGRVPLPVPPSIGATCTAWRRKIVKGEPLVARAQGKPLSIYSTTAKGPLAARPRSVDDVRIPHPTHEGSTIRIARIFHPATVVDCPQCREVIPLRSWWLHGCERALVSRLEAPLGDFAELTAGAAAPAFEDADQAA